MKLRLYNLTLLALLLYSCDSKRQTEETFFPSGQLETRREFFSKDTSYFYITYYREDGSLVCEGEKQDGKKQGKWTYYYQDNNLKTIENFCNGLLCDTQKYFFPNGQIELIKILEQEIECFCDTPCVFSYNLIAYWENGNLREKSYFKNCEFHNTTFLYDSLTGKLTYEIGYKHGVKDGHYKKYYEDGAIMQGEYSQGDPIGKWFTLLGDSIISEKFYDDK